MKKEIVACPLCGGWLKSGKRIPPKGIFFSGAMGRKFYCIHCDKDVLPVIFDSEKEYHEFISELKAENDNSNES